MRATDNTRITLTVKQLKRLVREARRDRIDDPSSVIDGTAEVRKAIAEMKKMGDDAAKVKEMQELLDSITPEALAGAVSARDARVAASRAIYQQYKPVSDAAKKLADAIGAKGDVFFSVRKNARRIGVMLTQKEEDDASYARVVKVITDPEFQAQHKEAKKVIERVVSALDEAKKLLEECGMSGSTSWQTDLYARNARGEMQRLREGFKDSIRGAATAAMGFIRRIASKLWDLVPRFRRDMDVAAVQLEDYNQYLEEALG